MEQNNNKTILNYIKANLGKDLNDNYNELGCAQTVNNIAKNALGYVAGGGPSTAKMLEEIVKNPNWKEVTKNEAIPGDIVLSATGTGNGNIAHGHVGFLGENGVIYSNNSAKDMLDDHLTATDWRNYFSLKGGFPVRYFRAVGVALVKSTTESNIPKVLQSSQDPNKISLAVSATSLTVIIALIKTYTGIEVDTTTANQVFAHMDLIITSCVALYGIIRKYR